MKYIFAIKLTIKRHFYGISRFIANAVHGTTAVGGPWTYFWSLARRVFYIKECTLLAFEKY